MSRKIGITFIFFIFCLWQVKAVDDKLHFVQYTTKEGLSSNRVNEIIQTRNGFLWFGTLDGLNRFDGYEFKIYRNIPGNKNSLRNNRVTKLYQDKRGNIWILSKTCGITRFDPERELFFHYDPDKGKEPIVDNGVTFFETKSGKLIVDKYVYDYEKDAFVKEVKRLQYKHFVPKKVNKRISKLVKEKYGLNIDIRSYSKFGKEIWLGTRRNSLFIYNKKTKALKRVTEEPFHPKMFIKTIFKDKFNNIWLGTYNNGVIKYNISTSYFRHYNEFTNEEHKITDLTVRGLQIDAKNNVWIGTYNNGVVRYDLESGEFAHFTQNGEKGAAIASNKIRTVFLDSKENIWIGTYGGYSKYSSQTQKFENRMLYHPKFASSAKRCRVYNFAEDSEGNIWIANWANLVKIDAEAKDTTYYSLKKSGVKNIRHLTIDSKNNLWIGSEFGGLAKFDIRSEKVTKLFSKKNGLTDENIFFVHEDSDFNIWIATFNGLNRIDNQTGKIKNYTTADGLSSNMIYSILEDGNKNLWMTSSNGLIRFSLTDESIKIYDIHSGLQNNEFTEGGSSEQKNTGTFLVGGVNGFNIFHPDSIVINKIPPNVVFTGLKVMNKIITHDKLYDERQIIDKPIEFTKNIEFQYYDKIITLDYSALHFSIPEKNRYEYKLIGFDANWNQASSSKKSASYTNLDGGDYTFLVRAANCDGVWSDPIKLNITIVPPWWETMWFRISVIIFVLSLAGAAYTIRVNRLKAHQELLKKLVKERTQDLQEANAELIEKQEEIMQQNEEIMVINEEISHQKLAIEKSYKDTKVISKFGQSLTSTFNIETINEMICDYIKSLIEVDAYGIAFYHESKNCLLFPSFIVEDEKVEPFSRCLTDDDQTSLAIWCFKNRKSVFINDMDNEVGNYISNYALPKHSKPPQSVIYLPLLASNKCIGIFVINNYKKKAYTNGDKTKLQTLASYVAIALDNANAYRVIDRQHTHIKGSIKYAKTIQNAILPDKQLLDRYFDTFILFYPKDVVSGDFYWFRKIEKNESLPQDLFFIAVADCTGHGVPGAFMSMIGSRLLDEIVTMRKIYSPAEILRELNLGIQKALNQEKTDNNDGMDVCLLCVSMGEGENADKQYELKFSGAKRPIYYRQHNPRNENGNAIVQLKGSISTAGGRRSRRESIFEEHTGILNNGDILYLTSDGYIDQHNVQREKMGTRQLLDMLNEVHPLSMQEQKGILEEKLIDHMKGTEQRDDITILGIKL